MSHARHAMHLFTDSKAALREAVTRTSERVSALSLLAKAIPKTLIAELQQQRARHMAMENMGRRVEQARAMER
jgi:hypothetical protein